LQFIVDAKTNEPYRSNVLGTEQTLELCRATGIRKLHHISTAYVCGGRRGLIRETDAIDEANAGNDYEISKVRSETLVRAMASEGHLDHLTVYRPAIIIGDYRTGYTSTFHGFYVPLQLASAIRVSNPGFRGHPPEMVMGALGLAGDERKNFVPVDWVSEVITRGVTDDSGAMNGQTLHLTPGHRVSVRDMAAAIADAIPTSETDSKSSQSQPTSSAANPLASPATKRDSTALLDFFQTQMRVYEAYWRDDPEFDRSVIKRLMPDLPCPEIDYASMLRLCRYAIKTNFGSRRDLPQKQPEPLFDNISFCESNLGTKATIKVADRLFGFRITGAGGGDYSLCLLSDRAQVSVGMPASSSATFRMNRTTMDNMLVGQLEPLAAIRRGQIAVLDVSRVLNDAEIERIVLAFVKSTSQRNVDRREVLA
jgi:nucleoside-diphosphate-sugar epimerase